MIRPMMHNQTYLGQIRYRPYRKQGNGRRHNSVPVEWFPGKHTALISQELFDRSLQVCSLATGRRTPIRNLVSYPLSGILYCGFCNARMRAQKSTSSRRYYHCLGQIEWMNGCQQKGVNADYFEEQVRGF
jgi:recombinase-like zinc beta ribbon protein/recombinase